MAATGCLLDSRNGWRGVFENITSDIPGIKERLKGLADFQEALSTDFAAVCNEVQVCQSMVLEGGHCLTKVLDGSRKPMRQ